MYKGEMSFSLRGGDMKNLSVRIYEIVSNIPRGEVMTYGQIAEMLGE